MMGGVYNRVDEARRHGGAVTYAAVGVIGWEKAL